MGIKISSDSLGRFIDRALFFILSIFVVVLSVAVIWYLRPFYGYGLDNTVVQVIGQDVSGFHEIMFQFSASLYIWYAYTWIFLILAPCLIILCALYLSLLSNSGLKKKRIAGKLYAYAEHVFALDFVQRFYKPLKEFVNQTSERLMKKHDLEAAKDEVPTKGGKWKTYAWHMSIIIIVALVVLTYRYAVFPVPQGWDTEWYIYMIKRIQRNPTLLTTVYIGRVFSIAILYALTSISGLMAEQVMMLLTPIIGIVYMVGVYLLVATGTRNRLVALLAAIYTPLTFITIRLSLDLYSNYLAWAFAMYALVLFLKTMETKETRIGYTLATMIVFVLIAFTHAYTFILLTGIILLYNLVELLTKGVYKRTITRSLIIYAPFIIVVVFQSKSMMYGLTLLGVFSTSTLWQNASQENPYVLLLAIVGIIAVMMHKENAYTRMVIAWTMLTSTALITGAFLEPFRVMIFMPTAILAAHGTQAISNGIIRYHNSKSMRKPVIPLVFLLCFTAMAPYAYLPESVLEPSNEAMQQYNWIEQHYGFENHSIIVCVDKWSPSASGVNYSNYYGWGLVTLGDVLYDGLLLYLLQGIPDSHGTSFQDPAGKIIIIPDKFYGMTSLEYGASQRVSDLGIYEVQFKTLAQIDQIIRNQSIWLEDDFQVEQWKPNPPSVALYYNYKVTNESGILNISVIPLYPYRWFDVETELPAPIHPTSHLIIKAKGDIHSLLFEVHVYSDAGLITWIDFTKYITPENYTYLQFDLSPDMTISYIRLSFYSATVINIESYVQVDYIALI